MGTYTRSSLWKMLGKTFVRFLVHCTIWLLMRFSVGTRLITVVDVKMYDTIPTLPSHILSYANMPYQILFYADWNDSWRKLKYLRGMVLWVHLFILCSSKISVWIKFHISSDFISLCWNQSSNKVSDSPPNLLLRLCLQRHSKRISVIYPNKNDTQRARLYEAFLASGFLKIWSFFFCVVYLYIMKATCHSYQDYAQKSVWLFTAAMETPTNKVKMPFFTFFFILLLFSKLLLRFQYHTTRGEK